MFVQLQDIDLNYYYMLIGVQGLITTHVVLQRGSPHSTPKTFCLTGMISYAGGVEWGLPLFKNENSV